MPEPPVCVCACVCLSVCLPACLSVCLSLRVLRALAQKSFRALPFSRLSPHDACVLLYVDAACYCFVMLSLRCVC